MEITLHALRILVLTLHGKQVGFEASLSLNGDGIFAVAPKEAEADAALCGKRTQTLRIVAFIALFAAVNTVSVGCASIERLPYGDRGSRAR